MLIPSNVPVCSKVNAVKLDEGDIESLCNMGSYYKTDASYRPRIF
jgi:hypothetical protein